MTLIQSVASYIHPYDTKDSLPEQPRKQKSADVRYEHVGQKTDEGRKLTHEIYEKVKEKKNAQTNRGIVDEKGEGFNTFHFSYKKVY